MLFCYLYTILASFVAVFMVFIFGGKYFKKCTKTRNDVAGYNLSIFIPLPFEINKTRMRSTNT